LRALAASRLAEIDLIVRDYFDDPQKLQPLDRRRLLKRANAGEVIILDVRPHDEYQAGHIPHAQSVPLSRLNNHLKQLSSDVEIVAYCRGPFCVLAQEAVKIMRAKGLKAVRLEDGVTEWQESGMPIEK
jgi:rhodanese-related sulfurtransferase